MEQYFPNKREFLKLSKKGNLIPVYREILADLETPVSCFLKLGDNPYSYLLESVEGGEKMARFSFIGAAPSLVFRSKQRRITLTHPNQKEENFKTQHDPLFELEKILKKFKQVEVKNLPPFSGGAVGYLGYDTVRFIEKIPDKNKDVATIPASLFIFTETSSSPVRSETCAARTPSWPAATKTPAGNWSICIPSSTKTNTPKKISVA